MGNTIKDMSQGNDGIYSHILLTGEAGDGVIGNVLTQRSTTMWARAALEEQGVCIQNRIWPNTLLADAGSGWRQPPIMLITGAA